MSRTRVGILLFLAASLALGLVAGEVFFRLFLRMVPPLVLSSFSSSAAHAAYLFYGGVFGVVLFGWGGLALLLARFFSASRAPSTATSA